MGYYSAVGAAIGGKPEKLQQFVTSLAEKNIPNDAKLLEEFFIVEMEKDFSLFVFYSNYYKWLEHDDTTWAALQTLANEAGLSWSFYRSGEELYDHENHDNSDCDFFDDRIEELFSFSFSLDPCYTLAEKLKAENHASLHY